VSYSGMLRMWMLAMLVNLGLSAAWVYMGLTTGQPIYWAVLVVNGGNFLYLVIDHP
jgi:hypothetical protein